MSLLGCRLELAVDPGTLGPSVAGVAELLQADRVRQALDRAEQLAAQYPGPNTSLLLGWALWRNGEMREAEIQFRRAADAGLTEALVGMAGVKASTGDWQAARDLATAGLSSPQQAGRAHALLAAAAWADRDRDATVAQLRAWSLAEYDTPRGRAAEAMAAAVERLAEPVRTWEGGATRLPLTTIGDGLLAVEASVGGRPALLAIDLTRRQSTISAAVADDAGLTIDGSSTSNTPGPSRRWPAILSPRQAACPRIDVGDMSLANVVVAVAAPPEGADGVLGIDLLRDAQWSIDTFARTLELAPPADPERRRSRTDDTHVIAWLGARLVHEGPAAQLVLFPRVQDIVMPAGIDLRGASRLDADILPVTTGSGAATTPLTLGGWREDVLWLPGALSGWALDGGIAPSAVLGNNLLAAWRLHWYPTSSQLRVDDVAAAAR